MAYYFSDLCTKPQVPFLPEDEEENCDKVTQQAPEGALPCFTEGAEPPPNCITEFQKEQQTKEQCMEFAQTTREQGGPAARVGKNRMELNAGQDPVLTAMFNAVVWGFRKPGS